MVENEPRKGQGVMVGLSALFAVPLAVAWLWYANIESLPPDGSVAHGDLVTPPRPLGDFELQSVGEAAAVSAESLRGRWTVVHIDGPECDATCRDSLYESRQVHIALGRRAVRVQRLFVLVGAEAPADAAFFAAEHQDLTLAHVAADDPWLAHFDLGDGPPQASGRTYIVDPLGNLMLSFPAEAPGRDLLDDLLRLLRVSRIG